MVNRNISALHEKLYLASISHAEIAGKSNYASI